MRLHLKTTKSDHVLPFNYQQYLTGALHKWLGINEQHDGLSFYSFSWLKGGKATKEGLSFPNGSCFFISAQEPEILKQIIDGINDDPAINFGLEVIEAKIQKEPDLENAPQIFTSASPILVKRREHERNVHYTFNDEEADQYLTETLQHKLQKAGLSAEGVKVQFDRSYPKAKTKVIYYDKIGNRVNLCPVKIEGTLEQLQFAWNVGVGNSTGIGFGAIN